jgi:hypothetical protein
MSTPRAQILRWAPLWFACLIPTKVSQFAESSVSLLNLEQVETY